MSNIKSKMQKKKDKEETKTGSVISNMLGSGRAEENREGAETPEDIQDNAAGAFGTCGTSEKDSGKKGEDVAKETPETVRELPGDKNLPEEEPPAPSVLEYKSVPSENKTRRKQILFYPSLCAELEQIAKETGSSVNDLVNQVMLSYVNQHPSAKTMKKRK